MKMSAKGALQTKNARRIVQSWSKAWKSGMTARVFYPIYWEDGEPYLLVFAEYGHKVDVKELKGLKRIFIPSNSEIGDNGRPKAPDFLFQFSKVARLIKEGQKAGEIKQLAESTDDKEIYATALKDLEEKYKNQRPVVGPLDYLTVTEAVFVALDNTGKPDMENVMFVSQELSTQRMTTLIQILDSREFQPEDGVELLEVQYAFGNTNNRSQDGQATPTGIPAESALAHKYPDEYKLLETQMAALPKDSDMIKLRNNSFVRMPESKIKKGIQSYAILNARYLNNLGEDEDMVDRMKKSASTIDALRMKINVIDVKEVLAEQEAKDAEATVANISEDPNVADGVPTIQGIEEQEFQNEVNAALAGENNIEGETFEGDGSGSANISIPGMA